MTITLISTDHFSGQRNIAPEANASIRDLAKLIREVQTDVNAANASLTGAMTLETITSKQATAATETETVLIAPEAGTIEKLQAFSGATAAADESMTIDIKINGTSALTTVITLDAAAESDVQSAVIDATKKTFAAGDKITIVRTYTAGTPTPIVNTVATATLKYSLDE